MIHTGRSSGALALSILISAMVASVGAAHGQEAKLTRSDTLTWRDGPLPGTKVAVIHGDPRKPGEFYVLRAKFPPNWINPPHMHPYEMEIATVISGTLGFAHGDTAEMTGEVLKPGDVFVHQGRIPHYVWTESEGAEIQMSGIGPRAGVQFVNPAEDPRTKTQ
jgi:quercetin dioxygenase-like cupin family protein